MFKRCEKLHCIQVANNEQGVAIVTALLVLLLLSIIAVTSTNTTITEKAMTRSDTVFERDFYVAESAALEGIQKIANENAITEVLAALIDGNSKNNGLLFPASTVDPRDDQLNLDTDGDQIVNAITDNFETSNLATLTYRKVVQLPIESGSSLALGSSRTYGYWSYGMTDLDGGRSMIKIGYKRRF